MIKIISASQPTIKKYTYDNMKKGYYRPGYLVSFDSANNNICGINGYLIRELLDSIIGVVIGIDAYNRVLEVFCGDGIIETNLYGGGYKYSVGDELTGSNSCTWVPKTAIYGNPKTYGKCLGISGNIYADRNIFW